MQHESAQQGNHPCTSVIFLLALECHAVVTQRGRVVHFPKVSLLVCGSDACGPCMCALHVLHGMHAGMRAPCMLACTSSLHAHACTSSRPHTHVTSHATSMRCSPLSCAMRMLAHAMRMLLAHAMRMLLAHACAYSPPPCACSPTPAHAALPHHAARRPPCPSERSSKEQHNPEDEQLMD